MKKLFLLLAVVGMLATACEPGGGLDDDNNGNPTEQPGNDDNGDGNQGGNGDNQGGNGNESHSINELNKIYYTTSDNTKLFPKIEASLYGATLISNTYKDGQGVIVFDVSVTSIGESAFENCTSLTSVTIPGSVTSIGDYAFGNCTSLKEVYCKPKTPPTGADGMFYQNASDRKIYVLTPAVDRYKAAKYWSDYADYIEGKEF